MREVFTFDTQDCGDTMWVLSINCRFGVSSNGVPTSSADVNFQYIIYVLIVSKNGFALSIHFITIGLES
jgi:hypothetical protein